MIDYNKLSESEQIKFVKQNGYAIKHIKYPSEKVQLEAVKYNGYNIRCINNPTEAVQLAAVKQDGTSIKYINNPSDIVQINVVNNINYNHNNDSFIEKYITSEAAKKVYEALKEAYKSLKNKEEIITINGKRYKLID